MSAERQTVDNDILLEVRNLKKYFPIKTALGNIVDENGNITSYYYEDPSKYTLSEYMGFASYWKLQTSSFVTNWYESEYNFEDIRDFTPEEDYIESISKLIVSFIYL